MDLGGQKKLMNTQKTYHCFDMNEPSFEMVNELRQLTGAGLMTCKTSLLKLVEALKQKPNKMDVGYEIEINWKEHQLRQ